jgi:hypothetical protein
MSEAQFLAIQSRRRFFERCLAGVGTMALSEMLAAENQAPKPHFPAKAKNVILLFMAGAPSQMDLFYPKPALTKWHGLSLPPSLASGLQLAFLKPNATVMASPRQFKRHGQSGMEMSEYIPHMSTIADDICLVHSMVTDVVNHTPGQCLFMSGSPISGRPTVGAWVTYGLGSETRDLPGFVVLSAGRGTVNGSDNWSSGFLPSTYRGVEFRPAGDAILYLSNPAGIDRELQNERLTALRRLNQQRMELTGDVEIASRIASYELAFRMQMAAPELLDISKEPAQIREMYGVDKEPTRGHGMNCLLARRMVERGVRFIMLTHSNWDDHTNLNANLKKNCDMTDQPTAALIKDLKQRGLLDSTLVLWGGEFGRTSLAEIRRPDDPESHGRDHHANGFTVWLAGGGIKGGQIVGKTDELALTVTEDRVHVHDLQATMLHCLGLDHKRLTYKHMGREFRLTDVGGEVVRKMLV